MTLRNTGNHKNNVLIAARAPNHFRENGPRGMQLSQLWANQAFLYQNVAVRAADLSHLCLVNFLQ